MTDNQIYFTDNIIKWFSENARDFPWRHNSDPYKILIAEKLLQQTSYGHVLTVFDDFIIKYPNINSLSIASIDDITNTIKPLGFHNQRSNQLKNIALYIINKHEGKIPNSRVELMELPGVGKYISNAVLCFAFNENIPIIDVNVRRVIYRYFNWHIKNSELEMKLKKIIPNNKAKEFNLGIIDFSSIICSRKPRCYKCIIKTMCEYYLSTHKIDNSNLLTTACA